jgi:hypothetical protein
VRYVRSIGIPVLVGDPFTAMERGKIKKMYSEIHRSAPGVVSLK